MSNKHIGDYVRHNLQEVYSEPKLRVRYVIEAIHEIHSLIKLVFPEVTNDRIHHVSELIPNHGNKAYAFG